MPVAWAIEGDGCVAMFMAVSAVAAAWGAACTSVGDRSMRNNLKFSPVQKGMTGGHCALAAASSLQLASLLRAEA
jgi:hypothetical protein